MEYQCIECGAAAKELFKDFNAGVIKEKCSKVVDKYIEYDSVMIFLDAVLHKAPAYRHMLHNSSMHAPWKLLLIFVLCDTYLKWDKSAVHTEEDHIFYAALEWDFYRLFSLAFIEWFAFCATTVVLCKLMSGFICSENKSNRLLITMPKAWWQVGVFGHYYLFIETAYVITKGLIISSFGKLLAIPVIIWGQSNSMVYLWLTRVFIFTSNVSALKVLCGINKGTSTLLLGTGYMTQFCISYYFQSLLNDGR